MPKFIATIYYVTINGTDFTTYYASELEKICEHYKNKLD